MSDTIAEFEAVTKRFGDAVAVDAIDLKLARGEFLSILGPSGCGKTTMLRMLAGFAVPDSGRIRLGGEDVTRLPPYRRDVNTVFQSYALFSHRTVAQNVAFGLERQKVPRLEITRRVGDALRLVHLEERSSARPAELSGGQQQRVALARALVNMPSLLLLDEPLGALDLKLRREMQTELKTIHREVGLTFLFVTHDQEEAMTMSDRIVVMRDGRIQQIGTPSEIYERPANEFVADFVGTTNLLSEDEVTLSIRPERVLLGMALTADCVRRPATITDVVFLGPVMHVSLQLTDGRRVVATQPTSGAPRPAAGDVVDAGWRHEDAIVIKA